MVERGPAERELIFAKAQKAIADYDITQYYADVFNYESGYAIGIKERKTKIQNVSVARDYPDREIDADGLSRDQHKVVPSGTVSVKTESGTEQVDVDDTGK